MDKINVVIADDHSMVRQGIKQILELEENIKVIGEASNGQEAVEKISALKPHIALIDINMPLLNGIEVIKKLKEKEIESKIIVLTIHTDKEYLVEAVQHGASGYVLKDSDSDTLIEAIKQAYNGETYIPSNMAAELIKGYGVSQKENNILTEREMEILKLIANGLSNKEIGTKLFISEKTVKNHVSNIFKKLDIGDRTQAAIYAIKHGLN